MRCSIRAVLMGLLFVPLQLHAQGSVLLVGGGSEEYNDWSNVPYQWLVDHAPNKRILVMHYSTGSPWLEGYFTSLGAVSATSLVVSSTAAANDSATYRAILAADGIFLRGGDQYQYIAKWKGTLTEQAIREVFQRGGVVGGTSAGEAVLSQVIFDARLASVEPRSALRTPLNAGISFTENFLGFAPGLLADSHFYERGRIGRLIAMLALYRSQTGKTVTGAGVDYNTAFAIGPDGIAEVMGSGTVTLLRMLPATSAQLAVNEPLMVRNMRLDQLTAGFRYDLKNGTIQAPLSAFPYTPQTYQPVKGRIVLDGGGARSEWIATGGSIRSLATSLTAGADTVGILTSTAALPIAASIDSFLALSNIPVRIFVLHAASANDAGMVAAFSRCAAYVTAGLVPDSAGTLLRDSTLIGALLRSELQRSATLLLPGNDMLLSGQDGVTRIESHPYAAYYGYMTRMKGMQLLDGVMAVPRLYEASDIVDNRASALFWGMSAAPASFGVLLDNGSTAAFSGTQLTVTGKTPAIVIDARSAQLSALPSWKDPGKVNPRQNGALIGALVHVVRAAESFDLNSASPLSVRTADQNGPSGFILGQNYPNPFNGTTIIPFSVSVPSSVTIELYEITGRRITTIVKGMYTPGSYTAAVDTGILRLASAPLIYRMNVTNVLGTFRESGRMLLVK